MRAGVARGPSVWFGEESIEMTLANDAHDFTASLIQFGNTPERSVVKEDENAQLSSVNRGLR
ncbi:hypothetical protein [Roseicella aerolata]|uniref:Uncharacterized protein n=1 Tax=Roseicella aerolata TaxID=2883479 RepID=A0A9X1II72_9PROT|nr:hypothetical protein [Roseicella aerolata]MCB4825321.1 hypothetical protein [Roseicella aerolata]